jgi:HAD superfamily hydrolase (TIGR01450 family)
VVRVKYTGVRVTPVRREWKTQEEKEQYINFIGSLLGLRRYWYLFSFAIMKLHRAPLCMLGSAPRFRAFGITCMRNPYNGASKACALRQTADDDTICSLMVEESENETRKVQQFYEKSPFLAPVVWKSRNEASAYLDANIDSVLFDCDGVLYRTLDACPGASEAIRRLISSGKEVIFVTNNAGVNRRQLREKLANVLGIESLTNDQMVSSSYSCARYLMQHLEVGSRVHVIGSAGLCEELESTGFRVTGGPSNENDPASMNREELAKYDFDEHPIDALAVGHDTQFSFRKLAIANNLLLRNPSSLFVATNHDSFDLGT